MELALCAISGVFYGFGIGCFIVVAFTPRRENIDVENYWNVRILATGAFFMALASMIQ